MRWIGEVDRAVAHAKRAEEEPSMFEAPIGIDVADIAEAQVHPLAQPEAA